MDSLYSRLGNKEKSVFNRFDEVFIRELNSIESFIKVLTALKEKYEGLI